MKKFAEIKKTVRGERATYKVFVKQEDQFSPHMHYVKANLVNPVGRLEWVGTSIWNSETQEWHVWQKALPMSKEELENALELKNE